jgi:hypothetical protein
MMAIMQGWMVAVGLMTSILPIVSEHKQYPIHMKSQSIRRPCSSKTHRIKTSGPLVLRTGSW